MSGNEKGKNEVKNKKRLNYRFKREVAMLPGQNGIKHLQFPEKVQDAKKEKKRKRKQKIYCLYVNEKNGKKNPNAY